MMMKCSNVSKNDVLLTNTALNKNLDKNKVAVGMSGGVDSTATAWILQQQGYEVIGITMKVFDDSQYQSLNKEIGCCSQSAVEDARRMADKLGIEHYVVNFEKIFKEKVIDYFVDDYTMGRTPNPCIACNRYVKFDALLDIAHEHGAYYIATGHYSSVVYDENKDRYLVRCAKAKSKDQTYMFWTLKQRQLQHILTPLSDFENKDEVRKIAAKLDVKAKGKQESQEICFIPDNDHIGYLTQHIKTNVSEGNFVDVDGNILGRHKGIIHYTIGQRKGLGITFGKPMYVVQIKPETDEIVLGENDKVFADGLIGEEANFISFDKLTDRMHAYAKIRSHAKEAKCIIEPIENNMLRVLFDEPQRAITSGQSVVFYNDGYMIGGAIIHSSFKR